MDQTLLEYLSTGVFVVLWWLLRNKDSAQAEQIRTLFQKHDDDVAKLEALKLEIAQQHYVKGELDQKFTKLEATFEKGFSDLGGKFDRLSDNLIQFMHESSKR